MNEISISLSNIQNIKTIRIKGVGLLHIRRMGSGEDLDLSVKRRRINKLIEELNTLDFSGLDAKKASDLKKMKRLGDKAELLSEEIAEIKQSEFEIYKGLLSDDKDGKVVDIVMNTLTDRERAELFLIAFGEKKQATTPDRVNPVEDASDE